MWQKMPDSQYFQLTDISTHKILDFENSPKLFEAKHVTKAIEEKSTKSMDFGRLVHLAVLEPAEFFRRIAIEPDVDKRTKQGKEIYQLWVDGLPADAIKCAAADFEKAKAIKNSVESHSVAKEYLKGEGQNEVVGLFNFEIVENDSRFVLPAKMKADRVTQNYIIDLKTTQDSSLKAFGISADRYGYLLQAAFYTAGAWAVDGREREFVIISVEIEAPFEVGVYRVDKAIIEKEMIRLKNLLARYQMAKESQNYLPRQVELQDLWVPPFYFERFYND